MRYRVTTKFYVWIFHYNVTKGISKRVILLYNLKRGTSSIFRCCLCEKLNFFPVWFLFLFFIASHINILFFFFLDVLWFLWCYLCSGLFLFDVFSHLPGTLCEVQFFRLWIDGLSPIRYFIPQH
ncbi:EC1118_1N9_2465p [Saccharomyces cerevisiae EC1118]|uniref:Putative uncharacterized protein YNL114C n=2 Tax=Saccharomyces cerevisiae TaxID=4932 RepID=YNL4_YEAST|nr:RecName: Full=Putative uncharacterized protein YNL114C [Saccharomyces cerevisiae S288C]CAA93393.1 N1934 [Saccharomyces cerevisiae]CAA95993.1 unnamed protein product [Saccharomyces cerevisiae]CAY82489.1 EC1118_1N9_2465p [Saccharomyces cerevisiae EC1118]